MMPYKSYKLNRSATEFFYLDIQLFLQKGKCIVEPFDVLIVLDRVQD